MHDHLLKTPEAAARLGLCARMLPKLLKANEIPTPFRLGKAVRSRESDIDLFSKVGADMARFTVERSDQGSN